MCVELFIIHVIIAILPVISIYLHDYVLAQVIALTIDY